MKNLISYLRKVIGLIVLVIIYKPTRNQITARKIMGNKNFLGIREIVRYFGVIPSRAQILTLAKIPFSEETLNECKGTHILCAGFPMTILKIRAKAPTRKPKTFYSYHDAWYNNQVFANREKVGLRWYLIRKTAVVDSFSKRSNDQQLLIGPNEEVPRACELIYAVVLYFMATGERLFKNVYVRCSDLVLYVSQVRVGHFDFDYDGLRIGRGWDGDTCSIIGLASSRKSN